MRDLESFALIKLKAVLFLLAGILASALLLADHPSLRGAFLLTVAIWSFCRLYYFLFYVVEQYLDPSFRFAGIIAFALQKLIKRKT